MNDASAGVLSQAMNVAKLEGRETDENDAESDCDVDKLSGT